MEIVAVCGVFALLLGVLFLAERERKQETIRRQESEEKERILSVEARRLREENLSIQSRIDRNVERMGDLARERDELRAKLKTRTSHPRHGAD